MHLQSSNLQLEVHRPLIQRRPPLWLYRRRDLSNDVPRLIRELPGLLGFVLKVLENAKQARHKTLANLAHVIAKVNENAPTDEVLHGL